MGDVGQGIDEALPAQMQSGQDGRGREAGRVDDRCPSQRIVRVPCAPQAAARSESDEIGHRGSCSCEPQEQSMPSALMSTRI